MKFDCIFLDRDGVINRERADYVKSWDELELLPGSLEALVHLAALDIPVIIITNQSAIGRGVVDVKTVEAIHERLIKLIQQNGGRIDDVFFCPHSPDEACKCRKPKPGMLLLAANKYQLNLNRCIFIGDSITDFQAAQTAGCNSILVKSGRQADRIDSLVEAFLHANRGADRPEIVDNLLAAVERILSEACMQIE